MSSTNGATDTLRETPLRRCAIPVVLCLHLQHGLVAVECTCAPARRVSASRSTTCHRPACGCPANPRSPCDAADVSAWTLPAPITTFCKVHIDLLKGRLWLVPTPKAATAQSAAHNFAVSVFREVRLPDVLVSDSNLNMRLASAFWTDLHAAGCVTHLWLATPLQARLTTPPARLSTSTDV